MIVQLDSKARIVGTERAWELQKSRTRKRNQEWQSYRWFNSFGSTPGDAIHGEIWLHPASTLADAIEAVTAILQRYETLIPSEFRLAE